MAQRVDHKVDAPVCIAVGGGQVGGAWWAFAHAYEGQSFLEGYVYPVGIATVLCTLVAILVGLAIWRWERSSARAHDRHMTPSRTDAGPSA